MNLIFHGEIGGQDKPQCKKHNFKIDKDMEFINIDISTGEKMWLQLLLWQDKSLLRLQHFHLTNESSVIIHTDYNKCSEAVIPGKIAAGEYTLELYSNSSTEQYYTIELKDDKCSEVQEADYQLWCDGVLDMEGMVINKYDFDRKVSSEQKWYKGDFHTHTTLSDGKLTQKELLIQAEKMKLDFFVATDHNILPAKYADSEILVIPGMEVTSESSHFNAIGLKKWLDLRIDTADFGIATGTGMNRLLREAKEYGALRSINHPDLYPWKWIYEDTLLDNIDTIEIINDPTYFNNIAATETALKLWNLLWNDGYRIWGIGGSDAHMLPTETYKGADKPSTIGDPGTYVFSDGLSANKIIQGVKEGKVYVSRGIEMEIKVKCAIESFIPAADLSALFLSDDEQSLTYCIELKNAEEDYVVSVIENGRKIFEEAVTSGLKHEIAFKWKGNGYCWNRLEVRNSNNELVMFTNPIYKGRKSTELKTWRELKKKLEELE